MTHNGDSLAFLWPEDGSRTAAYARLFDARPFQSAVPVISVRIIQASGSSPCYAPVEAMRGKITRAYVSPTFRLWVATAVAILVGFSLGIACQAVHTGSSPEDEEAGTSAANGASATQNVDPGIFEDRILFGQSAALSGPARQLGQDMRVGILAAFDEANRAGGVHGRRLELQSLDDGYETNAALSNTGKLIYEAKVFGLIGAVGTPTSRAAFIAVNVAGVPFVAPFTGAEFLRDPELDNMVNLRASYHQETEDMVARLTQDLGITRIAVFYQNDAYGQTGLDGVRLALERRGLEMVGSGHYERNTEAVQRAVFHIVEAEPEAVIMIGAYAPVAKTILEVRRDIDPVFMAISFVGGKALADRLGPAGEGVFVSQVVPFPEDSDLPVIARYSAALTAHDPNAAPGFVSLEGYLAGRLAIFGLTACGPDP